MRIASLPILMLFSGCASDLSTYEFSQRSSRDACEKAQTLAGEYRCRADAEMNPSDGPRAGSREFDAAVLLRTTADGLDKGALTPKQAAYLIGAGPHL